MPKSPDASRSMKNSPSLEKLLHAKLPCIKSPLINYSLYEGDCPPPSSGAQIRVPIGVGHFIRQ
jgi:hypothetical protein